MFNRQYRICSLCSSQMPGCCFDGPRNTDLATSPDSFVPFDWDDNSREVYFWALDPTMQTGHTTWQDILDMAYETAS